MIMTSFFLGFNTMKLTKNFSFKEMTFSDTAIRKNIDNTPGLEEAINLTNVCNNILQPVRAVSYKHLTLPTILLV